MAKKTYKLEITQKKGQDDYAWYSRVNSGSSSKTVVDTWKAQAKKYGDTIIINGTTSTTTKKSTTTTFQQNNQVNIDTMNPIESSGISDKSGKLRQKDYSIYDGTGNLTDPYDTSKRRIERVYNKFTAYFYTQQGEYDASYTLGRKDSSNSTSSKKEKEFSGELKSFNTSNVGQGQIPTMSIQLFALRSWEQILFPNDYVTIRVSQTFPDDPSKNVSETTLMTGFISNVNWSESEGDARTYTITCQGVQKILENVNLGLPKTVSNNSGILIFDINGNSNPANEDFSGGNGDDGEVSGTLVDPKGVASACWNYFVKKGFTDKQVAGILGNIAVESGYNPTVTQKGGGGGLGLFQATPGSKMTNWCSKHNLNWKNVKSQCEWAYKGYRPSQFATYKSMKSSSISELTSWFCTNIEGAGIPNMSNRVANAKKAYNKYHK